MSLITWSNDFSVNVNEIDEQHKVLIGYINDLNEAMFAGLAQDTTAKIISGLLDYTIWHFDNEEVYFDKFAYVERKNHKEEHKKFISEIRVQKFKFENGDKNVPANLLSFLYGWLLIHIKQSDRRYVTCFHHNGIV